MDYEEYNKKWKEVAERGVQIGDEISAHEDESAFVFKCRYTDKRHLLTTMNCVVDLERGPRHILIGFGRYRGPGMKVYLENQQFIGDINKVRITRRYAKSAWCEVIE